MTLQDHQTADAVARNLMGTANFYKPLDKVVIGTIIDACSEYLYHYFDEREKLLVKKLREGFPVNAQYDEETKTWVTEDGR